MLKIKALVLTAVLWGIGFKPVLAQYVNLSGTTGFIKEYVEESAENWNKPILFVFYSGEPCPQCADAISMIYDIYEKNYINTLSIFEIDYGLNDEFNMRLAYDLTAPLSLVIVRINDGMSCGYYKIDNPQFWVNDPFYFSENITSQINTFLGQ